jgi:multidrug efflux pump subunit AcrA (membrane-fusion protein)
MFVGRVVIPGAGLLLAAFLSWQAVRSATARMGHDGAATERAAGDTPPSAQGANEVVAEGRVVAYPGCDVTVGSEVMGTVLNMPAREKLAVRKGDILVELRSDAARAALREALGRKVEAESELRFEQERIRIDRLIPAFTGKDLSAPTTRRDLGSALARRDSARAEVERLEAESAKYVIRSPIDGVVVARHAEVGETVNAAAPLVTVVDLSKLRIEAEIDEFDIGRIALHARATISAEGYRALHWTGEVEEIGDVVVGRQTRPEDPARPSDSRVLPVKLALREKIPLKLGQRVEVAIIAAEPNR